MIRLGRFFRLYNKEGLNASKIIRYALGEVALVVTGILIAVSLNNWNEGRKEKKAIDNITQIIIEEFKSDTASINDILDLYEGRKKRFDHILHDSVYTDTVDCPGCGLISNFRVFRMNMRGYKRLLAYNDLDYVKSDTLLTGILQLYSVVDEMSPIIQDNIEDDVMNNLKLWRDKYDWFAPTITNKRPAEYVDYVKTSTEYRNMLGYHYMLLYSNYIPFLENIRTEIEIYLMELENRN